jgi:glycosyltransferase involved in cell wall biosynthesis
LRSDLKTESAVDYSIVVPLYNEAESVRELIDEIGRVMNGQSALYEVILIDDGSSDTTFEVIERIHEADPRIKAVRFRRNRGKADALAAGFQAAKGRLVITMDGDLQDDPAEIPKLVAKLDEGYNMVSGWKKKRHDPISKRLPSKLYNRLTARLTGLKLHDFNCGFKIYRRYVVKSLRLYGQLHRYIPAMAHLDGYRVGEMIVNHRPRKFGKSKYGFARITGMFDLVSILFLEKYMKRPLHLFGLIGSLSFTVGLGISGYLIVMRLLNLIDLSKRPLFMVGVLLTILGFQFISIGLLGEMIASTRQTQTKLPIQRTLGLD